MRRHRMSRPVFEAISSLLCSLKVARFSDIVAISETSPKYVVNVLQVNAKLLKVDTGQIIDFASAHAKCLCYDFTYTQKQGFRFLDNTLGPSFVIYYDIQTIKNAAQNKLA